MEYLIILSAIIIIIGFIIEKVSKHWLNDWDFWLKLFGGVLFLLFLSISIYNYYNVDVDIEKFKEVQLTLDNAREKEVNFELATFQLEVAEQNKWLSEQKYWNNTWIFDICIPDEINNLKNIK